MTRQVNLNNHDLLPGFEPIQLPVFLISFALAMVIGAGWFMSSWIERASLLKEETRWEVEVENQLAQLEDFYRIHPNISNETQLTELNAQYSTQLRNARITYSGLARQVETSIEGFTVPLSQLSEYDLDGLWLESILLLDGTDSFTLKGFARDPAIIPQYFEQLSSSKFSGLSIQHLQLNKEKDQNQLWHFIVSNKSQTQGSN